MRQWRTSFFTFFVLLAFPALMQLASGQRCTIWLGPNILQFVVALVLAVAAHELGHAAAGQLLGFDVFRVFIGTGPALASRRFGRLRLQLGRIPFGGRTYVGSKSRRWIRARYWLFVAGGPAANLLFMALLGAVSGGNGRTLFPTGLLSAPCPVELLGYVNLLVLATSLLPFRRADTVWGPFASDGFQLLAVPFGRPGLVDELCASHVVLDALALVESKDYATARVRCESWLARDPQSIVCRLALASVDNAEGRFEASRRGFKELLDRPLPPNIPKGLLWNDIAWADVRLGRDDLRAEADLYSAQALATLGQPAWVKGTRGAVLLWLGRTEEAVPLLESALAGNEQQGNRAFNACHLAIAHARLGRRTDALRYLALARKLAPDCDLLSEAAAALARP